MKDELIKLFKQGYIIVILAIVLVSSLGVNVSYSYRNENYLTDYGIQKYNSSEDLQEKIDSLVQRKNELLSLQDKERDSLPNIEKQILIYQYLKDNQLEYGSFMLYEVMGTSNTKDYNSYISYSVDITTVVLLVAFCFIILLVFNMDFLNGTYRFLYQKKERKHIAIEKLKVGTLLSVGIIVGVVSLIVLNGLVMFRDSDPLPLLFVYGDSVYLISETLYTVYSIISWLVFLLTYIIIFLSVSMLIKNLFLAFVVDIIFVCLTFVFNTTSLSFLFSDVFRGQIISDSSSVGCLMIVCGIKFVVIILLLVVSWNRFLMKDMK
ncbi:MAG: hypothetical protein IKY67_07930 [Paludibacteraceae bacterium]|nr:hypothetical protein [Paludibacteraceae bacterium]